MCSQPTFSKKHPLPEIGKGWKQKILSQKEKEEIYLLFNFEKDKFIKNPGQITYY